MCTKEFVTLGEDVVWPVAVDARQLRRRLQDDIDGVDDAGDVAEYRQRQRDEELRAAPAVPEEDAERREHGGEDDLQARRAAAGVAHPAPAVAPRLTDKLGAPGSMS